MKRSAVEESEGRYVECAPLAHQEPTAACRLDSPEALKLIAEIDARYASTLSVQGRYREAIVVAERSIEKASSLEAESALGQAENILGGALAMLGRPGAIEHWEKALGHFERGNEPAGQAAVLNNLGVGEYNRGNWDQAIRFYRRGQEAGERLGDPYTVAMSKMNIGEVLVGQGNYQEAEAELKGSIRLWKTIGDVYGMAFCLIQLARINAMMGRIDPALELFEQARKHYLDVGAPGAVLEVDAWEADARLLSGDSDRALEMCGELIQKLEGGGKE